MQYEIIKEDNLLTVKTQKRLSLEPKDWRKKLKNDLVNALRGLTPQKQYLVAKLQTNEVEFFDVENILFYNVGTSNFKRLDTKGVCFSLERTSEQQDFRYFHQYSFIDSIEDNRTNIIAEWSNVAIDKPSTSKKPLDYWIALKKSDSVTINKSDYEGEFGIYIEILKPEKEEVNIVNIQKALLDGVISAFHKVSGIDRTIIEYVAYKTGNSFEFIYDLINNSNSCLSVRDVIQKYRNGVKWNPQDERCVDARIIVRNSYDNIYKLSGYIFEK
jgi:hypothetical protein